MAGYTVRVGFFPMTGAFMGLGITELLIIIAGLALLFGPGAVLVYLWMKGSAAAPDVEASPQQRDPAFDAARERYARGEINREEFEEIKSTLGL